MLRSLFVRCLGLLCVVAVATAETHSEPVPSATMPAEVLDLQAWKLTLPYNTKRRSGNPDEVVQPELAEFVDAENFRVSQQGDCVVFRAACDGRGTENSKYPRSELREMQPDGKDEASWATNDGLRHIFQAEIAVRQLPRTKEHVVCTQIHGDEDDVLMVRVEDDSLFIERNNASDVILDSEYEMGKRFKLRIVAEDGRIQAWHDGDKVMDWKVKAKRCYFKVGCYTQSNRKYEKQEGSYGEVAVYALDVNHQR